MRGRVVDVPGARFELARWHQELGGATPGWQRFTAGVTDDGEAVAVLRLANEAAAMNGGGRPEHADWQASLDRRLAAPATWYDCPVVNVMKGGDDADAGFVQVVQGRLVDPIRLAAMRAEVERTLREREARAGERQMPVEMAVQLGTVRSYMEGLEFHELRDPVVVGPPVPVP